MDPQAPTPQPARSAKSDGNTRRIQRRRGKPKTPPGTLHIDPNAPFPRIRALCFNEETVTECEIKQIGRLRQLLASHKVVWVNVDGLGDEATLLELGELFDIHPLALEDVVNVHQRSKVEDFQNNLYVVARMMEKEPGQLTEQLSLFLGSNYVLTFQEFSGDAFDTLRGRIREGKGRIRQKSADFLAYSILDAVVDDYFPFLESLGERIEDLETSVLIRPHNQLPLQLHQFKRDLLHVRRAFWPLREAIGRLYREELPLIKGETRIFLRDCYDHTIQVMDLLETEREMNAGLMELHLSSISNRMNEVMKVLTIISTIFIPLSFIAGVYGMNFDTSSPLNMPELKWKLGYPFALAIMALTAGVMLFFFRKKGWLGKQPAKYTSPEKGV